MKKKWLLLSILVILVMMYVGYFSTTSSIFLFLSDIYFIIGIFLLIIGLFNLVLKEGTFNFLYYSFKKIKNKLVSTKNSSLYKEQEDMEKDHLHSLSRSIPSSYTSFLKAGGLFLFSSVICILIYYFQKN